MTHPKSSSPFQVAKHAVFAAHLFTPTAVIACQPKMFIGITLKLWGERTFLNQYIPSPVTRDCTHAAGNIEFSLFGELSPLRDTKRELVFMFNNQKRRPFSSACSACALRHLLFARVFQKACDNIDNSSICERCLRAGSSFLEF